MVTYFINTGSSFGNKSNNNWTFTACYKSKSHCRTPIEDNQSRFWWFFIITIGIGLLVCCTFILMTEYTREKNSILSSCIHEHQSLKIKSLLSIRTLTLYSMIGFSNRLLFPSHMEILYYVPNFLREVKMLQSVLCG